MVHWELWHLAQLWSSPPPFPLLLLRLLGVDKVLGYALNEWLQDIRKNQLSGLLGGIGPMHSVVQLCECSHLKTLKIPIHSLMGCLKTAIGKGGGRWPRGGWGQGSVWHL